MLKNYFKIAWRTLIRDKSYSLINIIGLTLGLSACMLLVLFAWHNLSYDTFHERADRIYRMTSITETPTEVIKRVYTPVPLSSTLKKEIPGVQKATHLSRVNKTRVRIDQKTISAEDFYWADQDIFDIFSFSILKGNRSEFLRHPNSIVITKSVASVHFPNKDPLGKTINLNDNAYTVTGVVDDWPSSSHFHPKYIATFSSLPAHEDQSWYNFNTRTYFLANEQAIKGLTDKLTSILNNSSGDSEGHNTTYLSQALTDIHLYSNLEGELEPNGSITTIYVVLSIALLILLNACVNYINLSTARAKKRAKEVGLRKTFGSGKSRLIAQFFGETLLVTGVSFMFSLLLVETFIPLFNRIFDQQLQSAMLFDPVIIGVFSGIVLLTSVLAGIYPAFYLTSFSAGKVLKGPVRLKGNFSFSFGRKGMIIFQFLVTICLTISSLVILRQLHFIQQKDLGFDKQNLVVIPLGTEAERDNFGPLKNKLISHPDVMGITSAVNYPGRGYINQEHWVSGKNGNGELTQMGFVGSNFVDVFNINIEKGRAFWVESTQKKSVILNETAVERFGLGDFPIGQKISRSGPSTENRTVYEVVGVVEDFNTESLREAIQPVALYRVNFNVNMIVRVAQDQSAETINFIRDTFRQMNPHASFEYHFVGDYLRDYYQADKNLSQIIISFTLLAVFIAGLGLLGLVGYFIQSRTKELAIRKVLGGSVTNIIKLLSKDFLKLVLVGFILAIPIAWYVMNQWLQDFAYKVDIGITVFVIAGVSALLIALATISWQSARAALSNPVESLRSE